MRQNGWAIVAWGLGVGIALGACGSDSVAPTTLQPQTGLAAAESSTPTPKATSTSPPSATPATRSEEPAGDRVQAIYENNPEEATVNDAALSLALLNLEDDNPDAETLREAANGLLRVRQIAEEIVAPTVASADVAEAAGELDLKDVAVLLAAAQPATTPVTEGGLASDANTLLGETVLSAGDIRTIPGRVDRQLELIPTRLSTAPGATVSVAFDLSNAAGFLGLDAGLTYDPAVLTATGVREGDLAQTNGITLVSSREEGSVSISAFRSGAIADAVSGAIAIVDFEVNADASTGTTTFGVSGQLNEGQIPIQTIGSQIEIVP